MRLLGKFLVTFLGKKRNNTKSYQIGAFFLTKIINAGVELLPILTKFLKAKEIANSAKKQFGI